VRRHADLCRQSWFIWSDSWVDDSRCPYLETVPDAFLFALRTIAKSGRGLTDRVVTVWPYSSMARAVWSASTFPGDDADWPDTTGGMLTCVSLNLGLYMWIFLGIVLIYFSADIFADFAEAHLILLEGGRMLFWRGDTESIARADDPAGDTL
jgi:hypothetical protein